MSIWNFVKSIFHQTTLPVSPDATSESSESDFGFVGAGLPSSGDTAYNHYFAEPFEDDGRPTWEGEPLIHLGLVVGEFIETSTSISYSLHKENEDIEDYLDVLNESETFEKISYKIIWEAALDPDPLYDQPEIVGDMFPTEIKEKPKILSELEALPPTAFPALGLIETCNCWGVSCAEMTRGPVATVSRNLFLDKSSWSTLHTVLLINNEVAYILRVPTGGKLLLFKETQHRTNLCNTRLINLFEVHWCHVGDGSDFKEGHNLTPLASYRVSSNKLVGILNFNNIPDVYNCRNLETTIDCLCDCLLEKKRKIEHVYPRGYVSLKDRAEQKKIDDTISVKPKTLLEKHELDFSEELEHWWNHIVMVNLTYIDKFRQKGGTPNEWFTNFDIIKSKFFEPVLNTADLRDTYIRHDVLPQFIKRRVKRAESSMSSLANSYKIKILRDKSFEAETSQEWQELELRRYEEAHSMSNSDKVTHSNQTARLWFKTPEVKHRINTIKRNLVTNRKYGLELWEKFNDRWVKVYGGLPLGEPTHLIKLADQQIEREQLSRSNQLTAIEKVQKEELRRFGDMSEKAKRRRQAILLKNGLTLDEE